jgi:hypothetical protein
MPLSGDPKPTFFYPEIVGGGFTIRFDDPAELVGPVELPIGTENISDNGTRERLHRRIESRAALRFRHLEVAMLTSVRSWWNTHAGLGRQSTLVLDRQTPSPCVAAAGAGGNVNIGDHSWVVTFVAGSVEHRAGPKSNVLTISSSAKQVNLTSIAIGPTGTTARKIYRTVAGDTGSHKLVGTISDNTTTILTDNVADGSLVAAVPWPGSWETDVYNRTFTKAELVLDPFQPGRSVLVRNLYALQLLFRQGL